MIHAQYEYKHWKDRYITRAGYTRTLYKRYKHSTHCAMVQPQYEYEHGPIGTRPVLAMLNHCTRGTRTVHLCNGTTTIRVQTWVKNRYIARAGHAESLYKGYTHSASTKTGKMYITRAGHARPLYKRYKHSTHCAMVQPQYEYKHGQKIGTLPVLAMPNHCTRGTSTVHIVRRYK